MIVDQQTMGLILTFLILIIAAVTVVTYLNRYRKSKNSARGIISPPGKVDFSSDFILSPGMEFCGNTIQEELENEGMATTFIGRDSNGKANLIKIPNSRSLKNNEYIERFRREVEILKQLQHPNIVKFIEAGTFESKGSHIPYMILEYIEGKDLGEVMREEAVLSRKDSAQSRLKSIHDLSKPLINAALNSSFFFLPLNLVSVENAPREYVRILNIIKGIASALEAVHGKGVIHRNIDPANIRVAENGEVILLNFGIAKIIGADTITQAGSAMGKAMYMAPEQMGGGDIDKRVDLYALGVIFYRLVTGKFPFDARNVPNLIELKLNQDPKNPRVVNPSIPRIIAEIVMKLLKRNIDDRYESAALLIDDLDKALTGIEKSNGKNSKDSL